MLRDRLLSLPSEIEKSKIDLLDKQESLRVAKELLKYWEISELSRISEELDDKGKPKYSNETKRQAELQHRMSSSEAYEEMERKANILDREVAVLNIKIDKLYNEQGNLRAICRLEGQANE